jgi:hypothetical protein
VPVTGGSTVDRFLRCGATNTISLSADGAENIGMPRGFGIGNDVDVSCADDGGGLNAL